MTSLKSAASRASASLPDEASTLGDWDDNEERRLVRKIDIRCLVSCFSRPARCYSVAFIQPALMVVRLPLFRSKLWGNVGG